MAPACKVTVVCTAFNHERYLRDALEGFVRQETDFPFEILVNDDASTDGTAAILREYAEKYPALIRPIYQEKNLYSQGVNIYDAVFYPVARGEYIAICEGDDYWTDPRKLQLQADFLDAHPDYVACVHNTLARLADGGDGEGKVLFPETGDRDIGFETVIQGMSHAFHTSSVMARKSVLMDPPPYRAVSYRYGGVLDYPSGIHYTLTGKVRFLDRCMSVYRMSSTEAAWSTGVGGNYDKLTSFVTGQIEMLEAVKPCVDEAQRALVEEEILKRRFELLYLEGRVEELRKPPYDRFFREKPLSFRLKQDLKLLLPGLHARYRRNKGYGDAK